MYDFTSGPSRRSVAAALQSARTENVTEQGLFADRHAVCEAF